MNQKISLVILLAIALLGCSSHPLVQNSLEEQAKAIENQQKNQGQVLPITAKAIIKGEVIELEVAKTSEQKALGLMFREDLPANRGMLFIFEPATVTRFWMKNVSIPLDMIFLREGEVKAIADDVPPCKSAECPVYGPEETLIDQVIELRGGRANELGLAAGDRIEIEFFNGDNNTEK
jgi:uncharacterized membrane protein (UPF0127 family)